MSPTLESQNFSILSGDSSQDLERDSKESTRLSLCHCLVPHEELMGALCLWVQDGRQMEENHGYEDLRETQRGRGPKTLRKANTTDRVYVSWE